MTLDLIPPPQVRSNAALALSSAAAHNVLSGPQFGEVWAALVQALENSEQQMDFSEFKHAATLKHQVCSAREKGVYLMHVYDISAAKSGSVTKPLAWLPRTSRNENACCSEKQSNDNNNNNNWR